MLPIYSSNGIYLANFLFREKPVKTIIKDHPQEFNNKLIPSSPSISPQTAIRDMRASFSCFQPNMLSAEAGERCSHVAVLEVLGMMEIL